MWGCVNPERMEGAQLNVGGVQVDVAATHTQAEGGPETVPTPVSSALL